MYKVEKVERVRTCVYIDKKLLKEAKYQRLNISKILEDTLRGLLTEEGGVLDHRANTHTHTNREKEDTKKIDKGRRVPKDVMFGSTAKMTRGHKVVMDIIEQMQKMGAWDRDEINRKIVERLAWKFGGTDPRTVKNYIDKVMSVWLYGEDLILPEVEKK